MPINFSTMQRFRPCAHYANTLAPWSPSATATGATDRREWKGVKQRGPCSIEKEVVGTGATLGAAADLTRRK